MRDEIHRGKPKNADWSEELAEAEPAADAQPNPMEEENFPDNPARRAADREMDEPTNIPGLKPPMRARRQRPDEP